MRIMVRSVAAASVVLLALSASPVVGGPQEACVPQHVPVIGPACRVDGSWKVSLRDGSTLTTHGIDAVAGHLGMTEPPSAPVKPACATDPSTEPHGEVIYVRPTDRADRFATVAGDLHDMVWSVNGFMRNEAAEFGRTLDYRMLCDGGDVAIAAVTLSTTQANTTFSSVVSDLQAAGYKSAVAKYWVWYDRSTPGGGIGNFALDARMIPGNTNMTGPSYGMTIGTSKAQGGAWIMMHENGHNLGAVQYSSPNSSGAAHCNDGLDVMCYSDGGPASAYTTSACPAARFDCHRDDYFNLDPVDGSYVASSWNLGLPLDTYLQGCARITGSIPVGLGGAAIEGVSARTVPVPAGCGGAHFALNSVVPPVDNSRVRLAVDTVMDVDVCWLGAGNAPLGCDARTGFELGMVPAGATAAQIVAKTGASVPFLLTAF